MNIMKKMIILTSLMLVMAFSVEAEKKSVPMEYHNEVNSGEKKDVERAPLRLPRIDVAYDTDMHIINIEGEEWIDADVYLYDVSGMLVDYSASLNVMFSITSPGIYIVSIQSENWYAVGTVKW